MFQDFAILSLLFAVEENELHLWLYDIQIRATKLMKGLEHNSSEEWLRDPAVMGRLTWRKGSGKTFSLLMT